MKRILKLCLFVLSFTIANVQAAILSGSVSFDDVTDLYTYTYTLDTSQLLDSTVEVAILQNLGFKFSGPEPVSHTEPSIGDWTFAISVGGLQNAGENNVAGSFWMWTHNHFSESVSNVGNLVFSFTTERAASTSTENNYFIFNSGATGGPPNYESFIEVGNIVGPELVNLNEVPVVPENETYAMMLAGLGVIGWITRRQWAHQQKTPQRFAA